MKFLKYFLVIIFIGLVTTTLKAQQIATSGAMKEMGKTDFEPKIWLDTISNKTHLYALGPYGKLQGEITVVDGKSFYTTAYEHGASVTNQSWNIKAPFFVSANVDNWNVFEIKDSVTSVATIQQIVKAMALENGYDTKTPFAFKIIGRLDEATFHVVTPRSKDVTGYRKNIKSQNFTFNDVDGQIIGFYSENHHGVFTGSTSNIHVHFIKDDFSFMGHLDKINTKNNTLKLFLPAQNKTH